MRFRTIALALGALLALVPNVDAAAIAVRLHEGNARGVLVLRSLDGAELAYGELRQNPIGALIESRMVLNFKDGSLWDEEVVFSQQSVLRLERYHHVQRGPSFPKAEIAFDRRTSTYDAVMQDKPDSEEKRARRARDA